MDKDFLQASDPHQLFDQWFKEACARDDIKEPTAMCLATMGEMPSARMVLLKEYDARGFVFYTNLESRKSEEIIAQQSAALCFYWAALDKQIRIVGTVEAVSDAEANAYFASRSRGKQIGAWASEQSRPMEGGGLAARVREFEVRFDGQDVPRPPHWSGWRIVPQEMEFWHQQEFRLHERVRFVRQAGVWDGAVLYP